MAAPCGCGKSALPKSTPAVALSRAALLVASPDAPRLVAYVHKYPPTHNAGAEWALHHTLAWLNARGAESRVITSQPVRIDGRPEGVFSGVHVSSQPGPKAIDTWGRWATALVTHLDATPLAVRLAARWGLPEYHLVHNHRQLAFHKVAPSGTRTAVFNSAWTQAEAAWPGEQIVLHPPVPPDFYRVPNAGPDGRVLFVNPTAPKGAPLVYALAAARPDLRFTVVGGAYGVQMAAPGLPNVAYHPQVPDLRPFLADASVVLMPSSYESWGRVAVEAACSGIPSVISAAPGLAEAMGNAAISVPVETAPAGTVGGRSSLDVVATPGSVAAWGEALDSVIASYDAWSNHALARSLYLWSKTLAQLNAFDGLVRRVAVDA